MFVLVEFNKNLKIITKELEKKDLMPIFLFKINFNNKKQIKEDIFKNLELKKKVLNNYTAILVNIEKIENFTKNYIEEFKKNFDLIIGQGGLNKINSFFIENTNIDFILDPQNSKEKFKIDFIHHFNSGINQILAKNMKNNDIGFIFSLNNFENKYYLKDIGRINQNLKLARKYSIPTYINFIITKENQIKSKVELNNIYSLFELSTKQNQISFKILKQRCLLNIKEKTPDYITKNIRIVD